MLSHVLAEQVKTFNLKDVKNAQMGAIYAIKTTKHYAYNVKREVVFIKNSATQCVQLITPNPLMVLFAKGVSTH